jgi:hypothetical protein
MTACTKRKELSKAAISAVYRADEAKDQVSRTTAAQDPLGPFDAELRAAENLELHAVLTLATHRKQHGC